MTKNQYRNFFVSIKDDVKLTKIVESIGFNRNTFSLFINGNDDVLSIVSLEKIRNKTLDTAKGIMSKDKIYSK